MHYRVISGLELHMNAIQILANRCSLNLLSDFNYIVNRGTILVQIVSPCSALEDFYHSVVSLGFVLANPFYLENGVYEIEIRGYLS